MSLVLQILRILSGCLFSQSGQIPRFPILPTLGISVLCLFFSLSIALFGNTANHTVFLTESDVVMGTGKNAHGQLSVPAVTQSSVPIQSKFGIRQIASGDHHSVYLMWDGTVWAVGSNSVGQLGDGSTLQRDHPVQVTDLSGNPLSGVVKISAGAIHTVFLMGDRTVWATGSNEYGRLGDGTTVNKSNPVQVVDNSGNPFSGVVDISTGQYHSTFLKSDGTVWSTGYNQYGSLGDGTIVDRDVPGPGSGCLGDPLTQIIQISGGGISYLVLTD